MTAQNAAGLGAPSPSPRRPIRDRVQAKPDAPTGVKAVPVDGSAAGKGVVKVSWTAPSDNGSPIDSYFVYADNGSGCAVNAPLLSCDITGLTGGGSIAVNVTAANGLGEGLASESVLVTLLTKPPAPRGATATAGNGNAVVSWKAPKSDGGSPITSYDVRVLDDPAAPLPLPLPGCTVTDGTSCTVTGLTNGVSYSFVVTAQSAVGKGKAATTPVVTPEAPPMAAPAAPTDVTVDLADGRPAGNGKVTVSWTAASDNGSPIDSYTVWYGDNTFGCMTTGTTCFIGGLTGGETIAIRVVASNGMGDGPASADVLATPLTKPRPPRKATAIAGDGSAVVSWKAPKSNGGSPITSYDVRVLDEAGSPLFLTGCSAPRGKSCTVTGLTNDVAYSFAIVAQTALGESKPATTAPVTPTGVAVPATAPAAPTLDAPIAGDRSISVSWAPNFDGGSPITGYVVTATSPGGTSTCLTDATSTACTLNGLTNGQPYFVVVQATNIVGSSVGSIGQFATPAAPTTPTPPDTPATPVTPVTPTTRTRRRRRSRRRRRTPRRRRRLRPHRRSATRSPATGGSPCRGPRTPTVAARSRATPSARHPAVRPARRPVR